MNKLPRAKTENLVVQNLNDGILIYNLTDNKAFCLNETSAIVYQACDGKTTFADLQSKSGFPEDLIHLTLSELEKQGFIEMSSDYVSTLNGMSRREAVKKVGLATMIALPVVSSLVAPLAADAASGICNWTIGCQPPGTIVCPPGCAGATITFQNCSTNDGSCGNCTGISQYICPVSQSSSTIDFILVSVS